MIILIGWILCQFFGKKKITFPQGHNHFKRGDVITIYRTQKGNERAIKVILSHKDQVWTT